MYNINTKYFNPRLTIGLCAVALICLFCFLKKACKPKPPPEDVVIDDEFVGVPIDSTSKSKA